MSLKIEIASKGDISPMLSIYSRYVSNTTFSFEYTPPTFEDFSQRFDRITARFPWLVCKDGEKVIGYAYGDIAFTRAAYQWDADLSVYIDEKCHRGGIGRALYYCLEHILSLQGYHTVYGIVTGENTVSKNFHHHMGYDLVGTFPGTGYKSGKWLSVDWFSKHILPLSDNPEVPAAFSELDAGEVNKILQEGSALIKI